MERRQWFSQISVGKERIDFNRTSHGCKKQRSVSREEMDIGSGGQGHATHMSMRYEYANVQAPRI